MSASFYLCKSTSDGKCCVNVIQNNHKKKRCIKNSIRCINIASSKYKNISAYTSVLFRYHPFISKH